jgi:hypothetical protein
MRKGDLRLGALRLTTAYPPGHAAQFTAAITAV